MVAYSFKRRFVAPIQVGLGQIEHIPGTEYVPKRQTIRADRARHARMDEELQLYCGMRTKGCFLIGRARCTTVMPIHLNLEQTYINVGGVRAKDPEHFARRDGFASLADMAAFWLDTHGGVVFSGVIIFWYSSAVMSANRIDELPRKQPVDRLLVRAPTGRREFHGRAGLL